MRTIRTYVTKNNSIWGVELSKVYSKNESIYYRRKLPCGYVLYRLTFLELIREEYSDNDVCNLRIIYLPYSIYKSINNTPKYHTRYIYVIRCGINAFDVEYGTLYKISSYSQLMDRIAYSWYIILLKLILVIILIISVCKFEFFTNEY